MWPETSLIFCHSALLRLSGGRAGIASRALFLAFAILSPAARAATFPLAPAQMLVGAPGLYVTNSEDTLLDVARDNDLGYGQLIAVNSGIDPWLPGPGREITLPNAYLLPPGPRQGIVIDLAAQRLFYFPPGGRTVETFPIGVGAEAGMTPRGTTRVVAKSVRPAWYPPKSIREEKPELPAMVPPGPSNPLGEYALRLGWPTYLIHGTNKPYGVGRNVSHGCIRLYPEDIARLFREVTVGTPVRVIDDDIHLAWIDGELYLALSPSHTQMDEISQNQPMTPQFPPQLYARIVEAAGEEIKRVDWHMVSRIGDNRPGMPVRITEISSPSESSEH